jgi:RNA polymerase sigma factor (sigma-70 family)
LIDLVERTDWFKSHILPHQAALRARLRKASACESDLDDLVSETLVRAYGADDWNQVRNGRPYLFRIARNILVDAARRDAIASFDTVADVDDKREDWSTQSTIFARDELRQVQRAIETLPPQCRRVFVLRRVHERSIGEIAEEMELSISTVEKHLAKALLLVSRAIAEIEAGTEEGGPERGRISSPRPGVARGDGGEFLREAAR